MQNNGTLSSKSNTSVKVFVAPGNVNINIYMQHRANLAKVAMRGEEEEVTIAFYE